MHVLPDTENDGLEFEVDLEGCTYKGIITYEALSDHFNLPSNEMPDIEHFFADKNDLLEQEICNALLRHPPLGKENILIFPHHMR